MTRDQATAIVALLIGAYPYSTKVRKPETERLYLMQLEPLEYDAASAAVRDVLDFSKYWPSWSEFRAAYDRHRKRAGARPPICPECEVSVNWGHAADCSHAREAA